MVKQLGSPKKGHPGQAVGFTQEKGMPEWSVFKHKTEILLQDGITRARRMIAGSEGGFGGWPGQLDDGETMHDDDVMVESGQPDVVIKPETAHLHLDGSEDGTENKRRKNAV